MEPKFRIKEEKYKSGKIKFYPEVSTSEGKTWINISDRRYGYNDESNIDWCKTYDEALIVIEKFKNGSIIDNIVEQNIYDI